MKNIVAGLPHFAVGKVVKGFGRGSKQLGIPTANFPVDVVKGLPENLETGVYFGWASINDGLVYKMVMSIGWNPFYKNNQKSMETHIMHEFEEDFYDQQLKVCILGYLRPELNFDSLQSLIDAIQNDISDANRLLNEEYFLNYKNNIFFEKENDGKI